MAQKTPSKSRPRPGRPPEYAAQIALRLSADHLARIAAALDENEERAAFIRSAIERELRRRKKAS